MAILKRNFLLSFLTCSQICIISSQIWAPQKKKPCLVPCRFLAGTQPSDTWRCLSETTVEFPFTALGFGSSKFWFLSCRALLCKASRLRQGFTPCPLQNCGNWERYDFLGELHRLSLHGVFGGEIFLSNSRRLIRRMILFCFAAQLLFVVGTLNLMFEFWCLVPIFKFMFSWKFVW
jgi:hypothetical protein